MILRVIDIETTGEAPPAEVIEVGWHDVDTEVGEVRITDRGVDFGSVLFGVSGAIPSEAMAVHHIRTGMLAGLKRCAADDLRSFVTSEEGVGAVVAHNAAFEAQWFTPEILGDTPLICTYKAALRVWPDAPKHSNQVLRYWLGVDLHDELAMPPHRAQPDAYVTAHILVRLLEEQHVSVVDLIQWTTEPRLMPKITFGKHKGKAWSEPPTDYLDWLVFKSDLDADTRWNGKRELDRRRSSGRAQ